MAGTGPAPKPAHRRARRNADPVPQTVLAFERAEQPALPDCRPGGEPWPPETVRWWAMWGDAAQADLMTATDWSFLLDTALLHARLWEGEVTIAGELRLRVAKFGATTEDRARLRITFADADERDAKRTSPGADAKARYAGLRVLPGGADAKAIEG